MNFVEVTEVPKSKKTEKSKTLTLLENFSKSTMSAAVLTETSDKFIYQQASRLRKIAADHNLRIDTKVSDGKIYLIRK